jgi:hypothetical protein
MIERDYLFDIMGKGLPPEDFDFGGISGGPMLTVVENCGLRLWRLAGCIFQSIPAGKCKTNRPPNARKSARQYNGNRPDFRARL